jgi:hypothetical protein
VKAEAINLWALPMSFVVSMQPQNVRCSINYEKQKNLESRNLIEKLIGVVVQ